MILGPHPSWVGAFLFKGMKKDNTLSIQKLSTLARTVFSENTIMQYRKPSVQAKLNNGFSALGEDALTNSVLPRRGTVYPSSHICCVVVV